MAERKNFDVAVVGLGLMGSATLSAMSQEAKKSGLSVVGFDRFPRVAHDQGSSGGPSRRVRAATFEGDHLVKTSRRSTQINRELGEELGMKLVYETGGLIIGKPGGEGYHGVDDPFLATIEAARQHHVDHEVFTGDQLGKQFPMINFQDDERIFWEKEGGWMDPEACIVTHLDFAHQNGAEMHLGKKVQAWESDDRSVALTMADGTEYSVGSVVFAVGGWVNGMFHEPRLNESFTTQRPSTYFFRVDPAWEKQYEQMLPMGVAYGEGPYAFPAQDGLIKISRENTVAIQSPDDPPMSDADSARLIRDMYETNVQGRFPGVTGECVKKVDCVYTVPTDEKSHYLDFHPGKENVVFIDACAGHGAKHAAAYGEMAADLTLGRTPTFDGTPVDMAPYKFSHILNSA